MDLSNRLVARRLMIENYQMPFLLVASKSTVLKGLCQSDLFVKTKKKKKKRKKSFVSTRDNNNDF